MHRSLLIGQCTDEAPDISLGPDFVSPDKISVTHFSPSAALAPFVTQIYLFTCAEPHSRDRQPAALGHLMFFLRGSGTVTFQTGETIKASGAMQYGPGLASAEFVLNGPVHILGLALSPLGFVALTGKSASLFADRAVPAADLFGPDIDELTQLLIDAHVNGTMRVAELVERTTSFLLERIRPVPAAHAQMVKTVIEWLSGNLDPDVDHLYAQLSMSRSTAARMITRYFGCAPKPLMRKYRAIRAAIILVDPKTTPDLRAKVESLFFDQPHMIREIRQFCGRTPGALEGDESRILRMWLSKENFRDIETFPG